MHLSSTYQTHFVINTSTPGPDRGFLFLPLAAGLAGGGPAPGLVLDDHPFQQLPDHRLLIVAEPFHGLEQQLHLVAARPGKRGRKRGRSELAGLN